MTDAPEQLAPPPSEIVKPLESLRVTNQELTARVDEANQHFLEIEDIPENHLKTSGKAAEYFSLNRCDFRPSKDPSERHLYIPQEGQVVIFSSFIPTELTKRFYQVEDVSTKLEEAQVNLRTQGVNLVFVYQIEPPKKPASEGSVGYHVKEERSLYLAVGKNASIDGLKGLISSKDGDYSYMDRAEQLKSFTFLETGTLEKSIFRRIGDDGNYKEEEPRYGYPSLFLRVPYGSESDINVAIEELNTVFEALKDAGLFPIIEGKPQLSIEFQVARRVFGPEGQVSLTADEYGKSIQTLKDKIDEPTDQYTAYFMQDLKRVKFLPYAKAARTTKQIMPASLNKELIARYEICELVKTEEGKWDILLPSKDFLPPEGVYWSYLLHSRIEETWMESEREVPPIDDNAVRGYFVELASGIRVLVTDLKPDQLKTIIPQLNKNYQISDLSELSSSQESSDAFEKTVYVDQITKAIDLDTSYLKQVGIPNSDIQFYEYWAKRFWLTKEYSLETVYGAVENRFRHLQDLISREKRKKLGLEIS